MNEKAQNRRAWVKNAVIIFLAVMLILTFFSNTIMNYSLPEVAAQYAQNGSITSKIRTTATVKANSTQKITIDETRNILAVAVKDGDDVKAGDILFYLKDAESSELKAAREQLESLEKAYKLKLLEAGVDYYADELAITQKREELAKAKKALSSVTLNQDLLNTLSNQIKQLTADKKALEKQITAYQNQIAKLQAEAADVALDGTSTADRINAANAKTATAKAAYDAASALKDQTAKALEAAENAYEKANDAYEALNPDDSATVASLTEQINKLNKQMRRDKEDYEMNLKSINALIDTAYDKWVDATILYGNAYDRYKNGEITLDDLNQYDQQKETARQEYESVVANNQSQKDKLKLDYDRNLEDNNETLAKLQKQLDNIKGTESARKALDTATKNKKDATTAATKASEDYDKKKTAYTEAASELKSLEKLQLLEEYEVTVDTLTTKSDALATNIDDLNAQKTELSNGAVDIDKQTEVVTSLTQELDTLIHNLNMKRQDEQLADARDQIEIDEMVAKIDEQRTLVEKYEANSVDAKILATVDGQITSISAVAGSDTSIGQTLCEIVATDLGYACEITLTTEQSKRIRVGDSVSITNSWWSNIEATIVSLRNDPKNPGNSKIATITVTGDVTVGQTLNLTIGESGQSYDTVVPNSAIREDNNGKFVLAVIAKSSPLGNRYIATRMDVTVLASDDTNTAVSGLIGSEFIITTSTKPLNSGDQVRMANSSK